MRQELINAATFNGYIEQDFGYKRVTKHNTHWITIFEDGKFQMYSYYNDDEDMDKIYDTGIIKTSAERLALLIEILVKNNL